MVWSRQLFFSQGETRRAEELVLLLASLWEEHSERESGCLCVGESGLRQFGKEEVVKEERRGEKVKKGFGRKMVFQLPQTSICDDDVLLTSVGR